MSSLSAQFLNLIERNARFDYQAGDSTWVTYPHGTGWRTLPSLVTSHIDLQSSLDLPDAEPISVRPGQTICISPGQRHRITMTGRRAGFSHWSHFQCEILHGVSLFYLVKPPLVLKGRKSFEVGRINRKLAELSSRAGSLNEMLKRQALGWRLMVILLDNMPLTPDRLELVRSASRLTPVLAYIEENLATPISHGLLARTAGLSPSRFHVVFRAALGAAPYEYVQKVRLKKAQQMLVRTDRTIAEIGQAVGHPDPYHFSRVFRRHTGISPTAYRRQALSRAL